VREQHLDEASATHALQIRQPKAVGDSAGGHSTLSASRTKNPNRATHPQQPHLARPKTIIAQLPNHHIPLEHCAYDSKLQINHSKHARAFPGVFWCCGRENADFVVFPGFQPCAPSLQQGGSGLIEMQPRSTHTLPGSTTDAYSK
jgi:hypothetical protein